MVIRTVKNDFETLLANGSVAFYNHAEIVSIFLVKESKSYNVFTRVVFIENETDDYKRTNLTDRLRAINDEVSLGIISEKVNLTNSKSIFDNLIDNGDWKINDADSDLVLSRLNPFPRSFVPELDDIPTNAVLEKNFENPSYIIEFFSGDSDFLGLSDSEYHKMCGIILEYIPIDLCFLKDRFGNIIFQFPITLIKNHKIKFDELKVKIELEWHDLIEKIPELEILVNIYNDDNIIGHTAFYGTIANDIELKCGNSDGEPIVLIKSIEDNLILNYANRFMMDMQMNMGVNYVNGARKIHIDGEDFNVNLASCESSRIGLATVPQVRRIRDRKYDSTSKTLIEQKVFLQYGDEGVNQRGEAINDIRSIIKENCRNGLNIWDPYAIAEDILRTAYFCECVNVPIKVINSFSHEKKDRYEEIKEKEISDFEDFKKDEINVLNSQTNNKNINLEIRCQRSLGWKFHDRFLIFPGSGADKPRAWTIGTSLNSVGKSHSILMEVENSQNILDAFNKLWLELGDLVLFKYP